MTSHRPRRYVAACLLLVALAILGCADQPRPKLADPAAGELPETVDEPLVEGRLGGTFRLMSREPSGIEPATAREPAGFQLASYLFTGLVRVAPDNTVSAGVATSWDPGPDCTQWTFQLWKGSRFHNGEEVTSASFKRGWERAADGPFAALLAPVRSIDAADPYVLRVTLARPDCEFEQRLVYPVFGPVPSTAGPAGDRVYGDRPVGNGPFQLDGPWQHDQLIRLIRYENYSIGRKASLDAVEVTITNDPETDSYQGFRAGTVDWAVPRITRDDVRAENLPHGKIISKRGYGTTYLVVATGKPLDNVLARKAISLAIDRNAITRTVFRNGNMAATSLTPRTAFPGACDYCHHDPDEAKRLAAAAGLTPGTVLHFGYNEQGDQKRWAAAIKRQLENTLGLRVNYYGRPAKELAKNWSDPDASGIFGADHLSPGEALDPMLSTVSTNPRVADMLELARRTRNDLQRSERYRLAEQIALGEDLALIPLWYRQEYRLVNTDQFVNLRMDWHGNADLSVIALR